MSDLKIPTEIEIAELINDAVGPLKSIARGLAFERDQLRAEVAELKRGVFSRFAKGINVATRSAEIADSSCGCKLDDDRCCAPVIVAAIKKEYGL